jgi:hypothetical protein
VAIRLHADHNIDDAVVQGLRRRGVDIVTAREDRHHEVADEVLMERCHVLDRVLVTHDKDFLSKAAARQRHGIAFAGIVWAPNYISIGEMIEDLELVAAALTDLEAASQLRYLPL